MLALADMPFVGPAHFTQVLVAAQNERGSLSFYGGVLAPPHHIPLTTFVRVQCVLAESLPKPLARTLMARAKRVSQPPADLLDIDDEAGYALALTRITPPWRSEA
ncbi:hypothetical protein [Deinococcus sp. AJ005]|uniref:hypothetical protein n=1 Tax=Deinococcus sp. AJ005 TaxID=2652443 RepID=UPI00125CC644|nr:hypothetical protein [Deinococcus sp. AJ005]QFP75087.1 hypothetical protein DAAJ005_00535 [Deinococcus sp. AJ005]